MITISSESFIFVNIIVIILFGLALFSGYKRGFVYEVLTLLSLFISLIGSIIIAPVLASYFVLFNGGEDISQMIVNALLNKVIWYVIVFIALNIILGIVISASKVINKLPIIKGVNKFLGIFAGALVGIIRVIILSIILSTPLFANGAMVKEHTLIKPVNTISNKIIEYISSSVDFSSLSEHIDVKDAQNILEDWLITNNIVE